MLRDTSTTIAPVSAPALSQAAVPTLPKRGSSILVFSHDLHDARFHKRMRMFSDLGFSVRWLALDRERKTNVVSNRLRQFPGHVVGKAKDASYANRGSTLASALAKLMRPSFLPHDV